MLTSRAHRLFPSLEIDYCARGLKVTAIVKSKSLKAFPRGTLPTRPTYIQVHLWVFPSLAFAQTLGFSSFKQLAPKSFLWVKPEEGGSPWVSGLVSLLKAMSLSWCAGRRLPWQCDSAG